jgi:hypothetical protein
MIPTWLFRSKRELAAALVEADRTIARLRKSGSDYRAMCERDVKEALEEQRTQIADYIEALGRIEVNGVRWSAFDARGIAALIRNRLDDTWAHVRGRSA